MHPLFLSGLSSDSLEINSDLFRRFGGNYSDYHLYPGTDYFVEAFDAHTYLSWLSNRKSGHIRRPLSLYVHIPFCISLCFYCHFNQIIPGDDDIKIYLDYLVREIRLQGQFLKDDPKVEQLYLGGGTPTLLSDTQLSDIMKEIRQNFNLVEEGEYCIEIDSRQITQVSLQSLNEMGFNCAIIGVQDFDHLVQQSIQRLQTEDTTLCAIHNAQHAGFKTVRIELIYGLPKQTVKKFEYTLGRIISASPNQISLLNYLHLPEKFKPQRNINQADLPDTETRLEMLLLAIARLTDAGYMHIGMNLFAKRDDQLIIAQRQGGLHYGLQGYSVHPDCDRIALGISGIGCIGPTLNQNHCDLLQYYDRLERNILPILRGIELSADDLIRRSVMQALICHSVLSFESVEIYFPIEFKHYFATELTELLVYEQAGLITLDDDEIVVTAMGQLLLSSICRVFDKYLRANQQRRNNSMLL
ncbi:MAG: oxygen-independent coproporphyrinogen III oxidase [Nitrosomonas sp.]|uniref:oxygen-independent coproporphyrinogen III oxidase n=1 Tax=Nitrosomonas sp. TaxID=42353 RepID=UPI002732A4E5|nr:oxygen-independent coproporphyrinogen III oxidase [Nitrosomonas sp.]MDP3282054.1 oxygen-independent coproporphyrinogen III oxidase [Nitrosomonas sp.]